jgi:hypothetical protein
VRVRLLFFRLLAALAVLPALTACGSQETDLSMPPLTPEPTITLPPVDPAETADPAETKASYPARLALYGYLRAMAAGSPRACAYLAPAYDRATFGTTGCRAWMRQVRLHVTATDLAALRQVVVPIATRGPGGADYTVRFADLQWRTEPAKPSDVLAARFVLRRVGGRWLIVE